MADEFPHIPPVAPRAPLSAEQWLELSRETEGRPAKDLQPPSEFVKAQKDAMTSRAKAKRIAPPHWARRISADKGGAPEILQEAARRALQNPNEETLQEVYAVLNELARDPDNNAEIAKTVTREALDRIMK